MAFVVDGVDGVGGVRVLHVVASKLRILCNILPLYQNGLNITCGFQLQLSETPSQSIHRLSRIHDTFFIAVEKISLPSLQILYYQNTLRYFSVVKHC